MSEKFMLDRKIVFQKTLYTKCINVKIDRIGPSIILRSIFGGLDRNTLINVNAKMACITRNNIYSLRTNNIC